MAQPKGSEYRGTAATAEIVTPGQFVTGMFVLTICGTLYIFPTTALEAGGRTGWVLAVPAIFLSGLMGIAVLRSIQVAPDLLLPDLILRLVGSGVGRMINLVLALFFMLSAAIDYRAASEPIEATFFTNTPLWVIIILLGVVSTYLSWTGPLRMARLYPLFATIVVLGGLITVLLGIGMWDVGYLLPLSRIEPFEFRTRHFWASLLSFRAATIIGFFAPYFSTNTRRQGIKLFFQGLISGGIFLALITTIAVMAFGPWGAEEMVPPFMSALATLVIPRSPFTRIEFFLRLLFQFNAIAAIAIQQYAAASLFSRTFNFRDNLLGTLAAALPPMALAGWFVSDTDTLAYMEIGLIMVGGGSVLLFGLLWIAALRHPKAEQEGYENSSGNS